MKTGTEKQKHEMLDTVERERERERERAILYSIRDWSTQKNNVIKKEKNSIAFNCHRKKADTKKQKGSLSFCCIENNKGITLVALVVTIVVLLILAGVSIGVMTGENGIFNKAGKAVDETNEQTVLEKVSLMLGEYQTLKYTERKDIVEFFNEKQTKGEIDAVVEDNTEECYIIIEVDGYEFKIEKETARIIEGPEKVGGVRPKVELKETTTDGGELTGKEDKQAITINITNVAEFGSNYKIEVKDSSGNIVEKEANIITGLTGQASYILEEGKYTITVTGTKDGIEKSIVITKEVKKDVTKGWDLRQVTAVKSADGKTVPVPNGFTASEVSRKVTIDGKEVDDIENTVAGGFVIYQGTEPVNNENVDSSNARTERNQFVWVPYSDFESETTKMFTEDTSNPPKPAGQLYDFGTSSSPKNPAEKRAYPTTKNSGYREPDVVTDYDNNESYYSNAGIKDKEGNLITKRAQFKVQLEEEFSQMKASVEKYGGFYIGRYETGGLDTAVTSPAKVVKGQGDGKINNKNWYMQYQKSKLMANGTKATSTMIWGCQWDATLNWFLSQGGDNANYVTNGKVNEIYKGNYAGTQTGGNKVIATGSNEDYKVNNIYDMAGNVIDWTIETYTTSYRVFRGGTYMSDVSSSPVHNRGNNPPSFSYPDYGSRSALFVTLIPSEEE